MAEFNKLNVPEHSFLKHLSILHFLLVVIYVRHDLAKFNHVWHDIIRLIKFLNNSSRDTLAVGRHQTQKKRIRWHRSDVAFHSFPLLSSFNYRLKPNKAAMVARANNTLCRLSGHTSSSESVQTWPIHLSVQPSREPWLATRQPVAVMLPCEKVGSESWPFLRRHLRRRNNPARVPSLGAHVDTRGGVQKNRAALLWTSWRWSDHFWPHPAGLWMYLSSSKFWSRFVGPIVGPLVPLCRDASTSDPAEGHASLV